MKVHILISGKVQGVFYRAYTKEEADKLGLTGWVKNRDDGKVEAVFVGDKNRIEKMVNWCWKGSPGAVVDKVEKVEKVEQTDQVELKLNSFKIRY